MTSNDVFSRREIVAIATAAAVGAGAVAIPSAAQPSPDAALLADLAEWRRLWPEWLKWERLEKQGRRRERDLDDYFASPLHQLRQAMLDLRPRLMAARPAGAAAALDLLEIAHEIELARREALDLVLLSPPPRALIAAALPALRAAHRAPAA